MYGKIVLHVMVWSSLLVFGADRLVAQKMYWVDGGTSTIQQANLDGTDVVDIYSTVSSFLNGIAMDFNARKLYWTEFSQEIRRADPDGSNSETLVDTCCPEGIALDNSEGKMYWTFHVDFISGIQRANMDGSSSETIVPLDSDNVNGITFDPVESKIYWTHVSRGWISRSNLDGSDLEMPWMDGLQKPFDIVVDHLDRKIYWTGVSSSGKIQRTNLDGSNTIDILSGLSFPLGIALDINNHKMYWTQGIKSPNGSIFRANMNGTGIELLVSGLSSPSSITLDIPLATPPVPTVSHWGLATITLLLLCAGTLVIRRYPTSLHIRSGMLSNLFCSGLLFCMTNGIVHAQLDDNTEIPTKIIDVNIDSGMLTATGVSTGLQTIFYHEIALTNVRWMRLHFKDVVLNGSEDEDNPSFIRITSLEDGDQQILHALDLIYWGNSSAYFNGDEVKVELLAYPGTGENKIVVDKILTTDFDADPGCITGQNGLCDFPTDDRVVSFEAGVGRILHKKVGNCNEDGFRSCTAFLINDQHCGFLTAGHCCVNFEFDCSFKSVVEFNVPLSDDDGAINLSSVFDQFPIDETSVQLNNPVPNDGEDFCYFGTYPTLVNVTPKEHGGNTYTLADPVSAADGSTLRLTGYGFDSDPPGIPSGECNKWNKTLQSDTGPYTDKDGTIVRFTLDAKSGNSGSPVIHESSGEVYAIFTDGLCSLTVNSNLGTAVDHPGLLDFLADPQGLCGDCNNNGVQDCKDLTINSFKDCDGNGILDVCQNVCCVGGSCVENLRIAQCENAGGIWRPGKACCPITCAPF